MSFRLVPSTTWHETIRPDDDERYAAQARAFVEIQARKSQRWGPGRALHRKQITAAQGTLEVLDGLPGFARHGLFAEPRDYEVVMRLSNGGLDRAADSRPDVRGIGLRVMGVSGPAALGGEAQTQDFTFINQETFAFARSDEFVAVVTAASQGHVALLKYLVRAHGVLGAARQIGRLMKVAGRPFSGFATEPLHSVLPMANGPYAVRARLLPASSNGRPRVGARRDWAGDFCSRLREQPLHWDLQLQFFSSESVTPIEDASAKWPTPYSTVARLMLPRQDCASEEGRALADRIEAAAIDPWRALADHRPLGDVQRARKVVYQASQQARDAA